MTSSSLALVVLFSNLLSHQRKINKWRVHSVQSFQSQLLIFHIQAPTQTVDQISIFFFIQIDHTHHLPALKNFPPDKHAASRFFFVCCFLGQSRLASASRIFLFLLRAHSLSSACRKNPEVYDKSSSNGAQKPEINGKIRAKSVKLKLKTGAQYGERRETMSSTMHCCFAYTPTCHAMHEKKNFTFSSLVRASTSRVAKRPWLKLISERS